MMDFYNVLYDILYSSEETDKKKMKKQKKGKNNTPKGIYASSCFWCTCLIHFSGPPSDSLLTGCIADLTLFSSTGVPFMGGHC